MYKLGQGEIHINNMPKIRPECIGERTTAQEVGSIQKQNWAGKRASSWNFINRKTDQFTWPATRPIRGRRTRGASNQG